MTDTTETPATAPTSFVDLMANDVWSDADIKARLHAEIRATITEFAETELNRALQGSVMGLHTLSVEEQASLARFKSTTDTVAEMGLAARADMKLLNEVLTLEAAQLRLLEYALVLTVFEPGIDPDSEPAPAPEPIVEVEVEVEVEGEGVGGDYAAINSSPGRPKVPGNLITEEMVAEDKAARDACLAIVNGSSAEAIALASLRAGIVDPVPAASE